MFEIKPKLNLENIYKKVSERAIIQYLIPNVDFVNSFSIRAEKAPSASISEYNGKLYIKDFGDPAQPRGEVWYQFLGRKEGFETESLEGYLKALQWANETFKLNLEDFNSLSSNINTYKTFKSSNTNFNKGVYKGKKRTIIEVKRSNWTKEDLNYWNQFGLNKEWLLSKHISPISHYWITNPNKDNIRKLFIVKNKLAFVYPYGKGIFKIYMPGSSYKWVSNCNSSIIENWRFIKERKPNLIIQSSLKDIGVMEVMRDRFNLFKSYDFIAPIAEGIWFKDWDFIKSKYNQIIFYGNNDWDKEDNPGLNYAKKWSELYQIPFITNPDSAKASDISDFRRNNGEEKTIKLLKTLENEIYS